MIPRFDILAGVVLASVPCWSLWIAVGAVLVGISALLLYGLWLVVQGPRS